MEHYNAEYFRWQQAIGEVTGRANRFMYQPYIGPQDRVVDFGCGGGYLLSQLCCASKAGIEINESARRHAETLGIRAVGSPEALGAESADVVISSHALEHTHDPLKALVGLRGLLRAGGTLVLVTPYERRMPWRPNDINQHLFTWSPMNLGNLASLAGFQVEDCRVIYHRFPPKALRLESLFGPRLFHQLCLVWGRLSRSVVQVRLVARKS